MQHDSNVASGCIYTFDLPIVEPTWATCRGWGSPAKDGNVIPGSFPGLSACWLPWAMAMDGYLKSVIRKATVKPKREAELKESPSQNGHELRCLVTRSFPFS